MRKPFTPKPYQDDIIQFMLEHPRCNIFAGMGAGKSVCSLTTMDTLFMSGEETRPALALAPLRVARSTWPEEGVKWDHMRNIDVQPIIGTVAERMAALRNTNASVFTINYDNLVWLIETLGTRWPFGTVIADESTRLKSFRLKHGGKRAAALAKIAHKHVNRWYNLTGTPAPNGLKDLWGQMWFIDQGARLGRTFGAFESRWFNKIAMGSAQFFKIEPRMNAQEEIQEAIKDVCFYFDPSDYFETDDPIPYDVVVQLPAKAMRQYRELEKEMFTQIQGHDIEAMNAAAKSVKCLQMASGAVYTGEQGQWATAHDEKLDALESIVNEANGAPVLVAYHFKSDLARLQTRFKSGRHLDADPKTIRDWDAGKIPVLFAHPASAGHGLNLQDGGNILVFFSHWWNLEEYQQIIERIGPTRQAQAGHPRPVYVYHIVAEKTVDELVIKRRTSKKSVQEILLEAMK